MSAPDDGLPSRADERRWPAFTPAEATRLAALKATYLAGYFIDDDPYLPAPRRDKR